MYKDFEVRWEGELPGSPRQIWDGITKHGAAWVWDIDYEPRVGGAERGLTSGGGTVTAWEPLRHVRAEARKDDGWHNALDYTLDGTRIALGAVDYRDGTMVGIRTEDSLLRVYGRDVWRWPVGFGVHSFAAEPDVAAWREKVAA